MKGNVTFKDKHPSKSDSSITTNTSHDQLHKLFVDGLNNLYWAEKNLVKALANMITNASSADLIKSLEHHLAETKGQFNKLEEVFTSIDAKPVEKKCEILKGLLSESEEIMKEIEPGILMDASIIVAAQKFEHFILASYGTLAAYAEILGYNEAAVILRITVDEENAANENLV